MLGRQVDLISGLKDIFISSGGEIHVTYVCSYTDRQLHGPNGVDRVAAAAGGELGRLLADVIDDEVA